MKYTYAEWIAAGNPKLNPGDYIMGPQGEDCPPLHYDSFMLTPDPVKEMTQALKDINAMDREGLMVNHPPHYTKGGVECLDAIKASMSDVEFQGYLKGNAEKYIWRYREKQKPVEDLKKAQFYLTRLIKEVEGGING